MKKYLSVFAVVLVMITTIACSKDEDPAWANNDGSINGSIVYYGKANSVISSEVGDYYVDAAPYYTDRKYGYSGKTKESLAKAKSVAVVWQSKPNLLADVTLDSSRTEIHYSVTELGGNAVIALYDSKGTILWSFHIWCTEKPNNLQFQNGAIMMDRNIGATSATNAGLLFQWGRKDPFASGTLAVYDPAGTDISKMWMENIVKTSATTGTILFAIQNPTTYIRSNHAETLTPRETGGSILTTDDNDRDWYYAAARNNYLWQVGRKSVYDPCPEGYRVASNATWMNSFTMDNKTVVIADASKNDSFHFNMPISKQINAEGMFYDMAMKVVPGCDSYGGTKFYYENWGRGNTMFVPYTSHRRESGEFSSPKGSQIWTSSASSKCANTHLMVRSDLFGSGGANGITVIPKYDSARTEGYAVRCVRE